jgi:hypothetical protein
MRSPQYEQILTREGVAWEYLERVLFEEINLIKSLSMQSRTEQQLLEHRIAEYRVRYRRGEKAPPFLLTKQGKSMWWMLDGIQRYYACQREGILEHDAYWVKSEDELVLSRIAWCWNNWIHGERLTYAESLGHAVSAHRMLKVKFKEAADTYGISISALTKEVRYLEMKELCLAAGVKLPSCEVLHALSVLRELGLDLFMNSVRLMVEIGGTVRDAIELVKQVKEATSAEGKLRAIEAFAASDLAVQRRALTRGGCRPQRYVLARDKLDRLIRAMERILDANDAQALRLSIQTAQTEQRERVRKVCSRLIVMHGLGALPWMGEEEVS